MTRDANITVKIHKLLFSLAFFQQVTLKICPQFAGFAFLTLTQRHPLSVFFSEIVQMNIQQCRYTGATCSGTFPESTRSASVYKEVQSTLYSTAFRFMLILYKLMFSCWEAFCKTFGELQLLLNSCLSKLPVEVQLSFCVRMKHKTDKLNCIWPDLQSSSLQRWIALKSHYMELVGSNEKEYNFWKVTVEFLIPCKNVLALLPLLQQLFKALYMNFSILNSHFKWGFQK